MPQCCWRSITGIVSGSTRLLLVSHGRTDPDWDAERKLCGWDDPPLGPAGLEDARQVAVKLAANRCAGVYTSPLRRALQTAKIIASAVDLELTPMPSLREIRCGVLDGAPLDVIQQKYPDIWAQNGAQNNPGFRWPGGESYAEFRERVQRGLSEDSRRHAGSAVILVTHTGVIAQAVGIFKRISAARWDIARPPHGTVTEIRWGSRGPESTVTW